jgi:flagellar basal-body rod modification protein FlgD
MTTPAINTTVPPAAAATAAKTNADALTQLSSNFQSFLSLLTTQLKNQDPLSPMDSTQFTQQLTQMSGVQAQINGNALLQKVADNTGTGIATAVGLIGKSVKAVSDTADLKAGKAQWTYNVPSDATSLKVEVLDKDGRVMHAENPAAANLKAGDHDFTWNGKDMTGSNAPEGTYTLRVTAVDAAGATLATTNYVQGLVTAVEQASGDTLITVNGSQVSWSSVKSITQPTTTSTASGGS